MFENNQFNQPVGKLVNWSGTSRPSLTELQGQYCILQPMDISKHASELFKALTFENQGESWTYLPYGPFDNISEFEKWIEAANKVHDTILYTILDAKTQKPIGVCGYLRIDPVHGSIEMGHVHYSKVLQRTPAATEAMYLMMANAFEKYNYRRYEWKCHSLNQASKDAALRLGFKFEGVFRQSNVFKGRNRDTAWFSIIDSEWPDLKARFEKWLSIDNFDSNGKQILSLIEIKI